MRAQRQGFVNAGQRDRKEGTMRRVAAALAVMAMVGAACGGSGGEDSINPAAFEDVAVSECVKAPVSVGGISVLGSHRIEGISDLEVCVDVRAAAGVIPQVVNQPDCGSPCFTIEIRNFNVMADHKVEVKMKRDGKDVPPITYDPAPVNQGDEGQRICVVGYGGPPDPCTERVTTPKQLEATAGKTKVSLQWKASTNTVDGNVSGYEIWRSPTGEEATFGLVTTVPSTSAVDSGLVRKTQYWYYVVAIDADGNRSAASNIATVTTR
jgi:hypothetical protein